MSEIIRIEEIEVDKLFGCYSYCLQSSAESKFMILYGDNGCGKSTILSSVYHLLNPERTNGHRTAVSEIPFRKIIVKLSNGDALEAFRKNSIEGVYAVRCINVKNGKSHFEYVWEGHRHAIKNEKEYEKYCQYLESLELNTLCMSSNRQIVETENIDDSPSSYFEPHMGFVRRRLANKERSLSDVMDDFQRWMQTDVMKNTNVGNKDIDDLYARIIRSYEKGESSEIDIKESFEKVAQKNEEYKRLGLSTDILATTFMNKVKRMSANSLQNLAPVLESYVSSLNLRLDALESLKNKLDILEKYLSGFFKKKKVVLNALEGLSIYSENGQKLHFSKLSSGEKQVLYLLCSVVSAVSKSSIVIIDEPEISLNIKWQREFLRALDELIGDNNVQIIIASHSIDMITPYKSSVVRMESI